MRMGTALLNTEVFGVGFASRTPRLCTHTYAYVCGHFLYTCGTKARCHRPLLGESTQTTNRMHNLGSGKAPTHLTGAI